MKITGIQTGEVRVPLHTPFKTALRTVDSVHDVAVRIETDMGLAGYGEAPPTAVITGETRAGIKAAIRECITPVLLGRTVDNLEHTLALLHQTMVKNTSAKAAVDMALYDLHGQLYGAPLYRLLGGYRDVVETDLTISANPVAEMVVDSLKAVAKGYRILKVKVGREPALDLERMAQIRRAVGPDIALRVDANQGWEAKEAVRLIRAMEDKGLNIALVEQPVKAHDIDGLQMITNCVYTKILADESVFTAADCLRILQRRAADYINIKLMKTGGIYGALQVCAIAEAYGVECMIGCMLETKLSVSAAAHVAAAKGVITMADLDGPGLCRFDPVSGGPRFQAGEIHMTDAPGLGFDWRTEQGIVWGA